MSIETVEVLLLVAALVAMVARKMRLPYTVGLVLAGIGLALVPSAPDVRLTKQLIFGAFLPPLIFEGAFHTPWRKLKADLGPILLLAVLGVLISAAVTTTLLRLLVGWEWVACLLFGVIISATDPISVLAMFKEHEIADRLRLLAEAESVFNDGVVAVLYVVAVAAMAGGAVGPLAISWRFFLTMAGGVLCGIVVGGCALLLTGRTKDHLVEITFSSIAAFGSFGLAEYVGMSGIMAALSAGVLVGTLGPGGAMTERGHEAVVSFWEYVSFVANSLIFLLIGMRLARENLLGDAGAVVAAVAVVLFARAVSVYACGGILAPTKKRLTVRELHALVWGGLRGGLALALVLALPQATPNRDQVTAVTFAVVAFSVIGQGSTLRPVLTALGLLRPHTPPKTT